MGSMHTSLLNSTRMCTQHTTLTKTLEISDAICQFLTHHAENILHKLPIGSSCHSGHDASIYCSAYKIVNGNTPSPPDFTPPHQHLGQSYDGTLTSQMYSPDGYVFFHASYLYRTSNHDASCLQCSINHDASYLCTTINCIDPGPLTPQSFTAIPPPPHRVPLPKRWNIPCRKNKSVTDL